MAEQLYGLNQNQLTRIANAVKRVEGMPNGSGVGQRYTNQEGVLQIARAIDPIPGGGKAKVQLMMADPTVVPNDNDPKQKVPWVDTKDDPMYCAAGPLIPDGKAVAQDDKVWVGWTSGWLTVVQTTSCLIDAPPDSGS